MAEDETGNRMFGMITAASVGFILLLVLLLPMAFSAGKNPVYSAYVGETSADDALRLAQLTEMRHSLGPGVGNEGYNIRNTMSTPMLVNDWQDPHRTVLVIVSPEKPIDETEADAIHDFVTSKGGKVIIAADNTNANRVASKFGVTYFDAPLLDENQHWYEVNPETDPPVELPANWKNVWGLAAINESVNTMSDSGMRTGCGNVELTQHFYQGCRIPVMFREPTGIKVENYSEDEIENRQIKILAAASPSAFIDIAGDGDSGNTQNPAPGDLALAVRIDYPGITALDQKAGGKRTLSEILVTGSIVFVADDTAFSNRLWNFEEAKATGMAEDCDVSRPSCWRHHMSSNHQWQGNELYFRSLIYSMMELDNQELSTTVTMTHSKFLVVFDESRHVTGVMSAPFTDAMATIVMLTSNAFLKWLVILNLLLLLLVAIMVVPEKTNWRHVFDLTRFRERPDKVDPHTYKQRVRESLMTKVRIFYDFTRDEMALKSPAEVQTMIGDPRLVELAYSQNRTYSPEELRQLLQTIRRWGKN